MIKEVGLLINVSVDVLSRWLVRSPESKNLEAEKGRGNMSIYA